MIEPNEVAFANKALELKLINEKNLQNCHIIKNQSIKEGAPKNLAEIMLELKLVNTEQLQKIQKMVEKDLAHTNSSDDFIAEFVSEPNSGEYTVGMDTVNPDELIEEYTPEIKIKPSELVEEYTVDTVNPGELIEEYTPGIEAKPSELVEEYTVGMDTVNPDELIDHSQGMDTVNPGELIEEYTLGMDTVNPDNVVKEDTLGTMGPDEFVKDNSERLSTQIGISSNSSYFEERKTIIEKDSKPVQQSPKETFGRYVVEKVLGKGGMGEVCLAYDPHLERYVAIKLMKIQNQTPNTTKRFLREARSIAKLNHPHIITVYDIGYDKDQHFFVMDYVKGKTLEDIIGDTSVTLKEKIDIMLKVIRAVACAHDQNMIHRDLKPANIMLTETNEPKIMDFGLVKLLEASSILSKTGSIFGTLQYMSPEQIEDTSRVDHRSDIYSLGVILYELFTNRLPFSGKSRMELLMEVISGDPPKSPNSINKNISRPLSRVCMHALAKKADDRYQNAIEFASDLEKAHIQSFSTGEQVIADIHIDTPTKPESEQNLSLMSDITNDEFAKNLDKITTNKTTHIQPNTSLRSYSWMIMVFVIILIGVGYAYVNEMQKRSFLEQENKDIFIQKATIEKERDSAKKSENAIKQKLLVSEESLYKVSLLLANQYNDDYLIANADKVLVDIAAKENNANNFWEYNWQKNRNHSENNHFLSQKKLNINDMDVSDNGYIVAATIDVIKVYRLNDENYEKILINKGSWLCCAISSSGEWVASGDYFGNLRLWNLKTGKTLEKNLVNNSTGEERILDMRFNKKGNKLVIVKEVADETDDFEPVILLDIEKLNISKKFSIPKAYQNKHLNNIVSCDISSNDKYIIGAGEDKNLYLWDIASQKVNVLKGHQTKINECHIHPNNQLVLTASGHHLYVWNIEKQQHQLLSLDNEISSCDFSKDGRKIIAGCSNGLVHLWTLESLSKFVYEGKACGHDHISRCLFSSDSQKIYGGGKNGIKIWDTEIHKKLLTIPLETDSIFCAFHPEQELIAVGTVTGTMLYNSKTGKQIEKNGQKVLKGHFSGASHGAFDKKGVFYTSGYDGSIMIWNTETFASIKTLNLAKDRDSGIEDFIITNNAIIAAGRKLNLYFYDFKTEQQKTIDLNDENNGGDLIAVASSGDDIVVLASNMKKLYLFDINSQTIIQDYTLEYNIETCKLIQNQQTQDMYIFIADKNGKIIKYKRDKNGVLSELAHFVGHTDIVSNIEIEPMRMLSSSKDGKICIWPLTETEKIGEHHEIQKVTPYFQLKNTDSLKYLAISSNGFQIGTCGIENFRHVLEIWNAESVK